MAVSSQTWWWIGISSAAALTAAGGALVYRSRKKRAAAPLPEGAGAPPFPSDPTRVTGPTRGTPSHLLRAELCRQWKVGNDRPNWRPELYAVVRNAVDEEIDRLQPQWSNMDELNLAAFAVSRGALGRVCPRAPLPSSIGNIVDLSNRFWWDELWQQFHVYAFNKLSGIGT